MIEHRKFRGPRGFRYLQPKDILTINHITPMAAKGHVSADGRYGNHFWATVCKKVRPMISDRCPVLSCPVCPVLTVCL